MPCFQKLTNPHDSKTYDDGCHKFKFHWRSVHCGCHPSTMFIATRLGDCHSPYYVFTLLCQVTHVTLTIGKAPNAIPVHGDFLTFFTMQWYNSQLTLYKPLLWHPTWKLNHSEVSHWQSNAYLRCSAHKWYFLTSDGRHTSTFYYQPWIFEKFTFLYRKRLNILHQLVASDNDSKRWPTYGKI